MKSDGGPEFPICEQCGKPFGSYIDVAKGCKVEIFKMKIVCPCGNFQTFYTDDESVALTVYSDEESKADAMLKEREKNP